LFFFEVQSFAQIADVLDIEIGIRYKKIGIKLIFLKRNLRLIDKFDIMTIQPVGDILFGLGSDPSAIE